MVPLARRYDLTAYDASYLVLAHAAGAGLATLARRLAEAARSEGISIAIT